ncbi:MAG: methylated-DNA--[protein]-cysteine S-methyltransferase [Pirellulaceae bacterium]
MCSTVSDSSTQLRVTAFFSRLGWMAACWQFCQLQRLVFGYTSQRRALDAIGGQATDVHLLVESQRNLVQRLQAVADGAEDDFLDVDLELHDRTAFQLAVIDHCRQVRRGQVLTYGQLAARAGHPRSARAVGNVMATNRVPLIVPCHRVVGACGDLGGFSAPQGLHMKRRLLRLEGTLERVS